MSNPKYIVGAILLFALATTAFVSTRAQAGEDDSAAIRKLCSTFVMSWNKHDAAGMASVFAENGDMIGPDGARHDGRKAVTDALAAWHGAKGPMHASTVKVLDEPIKMITADVAISDAEILVSGVKDEEGETSTLAMHVTNIWKKADGKWTMFASRPYVKGEHEDDEDGEAEEGEKDK